MSEQDEQWERWGKLVNAWAEEQGLLPIRYRPEGGGAADTERMAMIAVAFIGAQLEAAEDRAAARVFACESGWCQSGLSATRHGTDRRSTRPFKRRLCATCFDALGLAEDGDDLPSPAEIERTIKAHYGEGKCEMRGCKSGDPATRRVTDCHDDGAWSAEICQRCFDAIGMRRDGEDLPEYKICEARLAAVYVGP